MQYVQSSSGKWHRVDCDFAPEINEAQEVHEQLPIEGDHCQQCIGSFEFVGTDTESESDHETEAETQA